MVAESWRGGRYLLPTQELCSQDRVARFGELTSCPELDRLGTSTLHSTKLKPDLLEYLCDLTQSRL